MNIEIEEVSKMKQKIQVFLVGTKFETTFYFTLMLLGFFCSFLLYPLLADLPFQFGKNAIGVFIPPFFTVLFLFLTGVKNGFSNKLLWKGIILYLVQILPFFPLLFQIIQPNPGEDFARYLAYAENMVLNHTLWGGDKLAYPHEGYVYITQPGYRYFVAAELLLFQDLYRFVSFLNILIFITAVFYLFKTINEQQLEKSVKLILMFLIFLTIPYSVKNILMGLTEWFAVILLILAGYFYRVKNNVMLSVFILGLVPFIRQNLLPSIVLLFFWCLLENRSKWKLVLCFMIPILLPLYHNLYYADEWRFFVSVYQWPFLSYVQNNQLPVGINYWLIFNNMIHYAGFNVAGNRIDFLEEAVGFLLFFLFVYYYLVRYQLSGIKKYLYLVITLFTIIPSVILATDFYPRFEYINVFIVIVTYLFLQIEKKVELLEN